MKYRVTKKKDGYAVQKGYGVYITVLKGFPTKGDAESWVNINVGLNKIR